MNYIYDILVNFNREALEFYEWDKTDNIEHIRRIPLFKINSKTLKDLKNNIVKVNEKFLEKINEKTEMYINKMIDYLEYASIFTDGSDLVVIEFSKSGENILKSMMLIDEAEEVLDESELLNETNIEYDIIKVNNVKQFLTRNQKKILSYLKNEIDQLIKNKNFNKLKYLYYEWYDTKIDNMEKIINDLYKIIDIDFSNKHIKFYDLIKFSNNKTDIQA